MNVQSGFRWAGRTVLVTGAGGFVGSWLARALDERGAGVIAILRDRSIPSNFELLSLQSRVTVVRGSITDRGLVERTLNEHDVDTCFHLAAQSLVGPANRAPLSTFESNVAGTWTVLEACRAARTVERVIVASSDKAYGDQTTLPYTEDMPLLGANPYDASKACAEIVARAYGHTFQLPVAIARCANTYGGGDLNFDRLIPGTVRSVLAERVRPIIRSDGTPLRDYMHVDDAVDAYLVLAEMISRDGVAGQAFNFGSGAPISVIEVVRRILDICDARDLEPDIRADGPLRNEIARQYLDSGKAERTLGWRARIDLEAGLRRTVDWYASYFGTPVAPTSA